MAHAQKSDFVFPRNGQVHLNRWGRQFSQLLAAEVCASAWVMLDRPCLEVAWEYWLPTPFASFPFTSPPVCHHVTSGSEQALQLCLQQPPPPFVTKGIYYLCTTSHSISVQRTFLYASFSFKICVILFLQVAFLIPLKSTVFHPCSWPFFHCECLTFFYFICCIFPPEFYRCYISSWHFSYFLLLILHLF